MALTDFVYTNVDAIRPDGTLPISEPQGVHSLTGETN
jgi:hypothetical protein